MDRYACSVATDMMIAYHQVSITAPKAGYSI